MESFQEKLDKYAKLVVEKGANVQEGKPVWISSSIEAKDFARLLVSHAYARGASEVKLVWKDDYITRQRYLHADDEVLATVHDFTVDELEYYYTNDVSLISIYAEDPELLSGIAPHRIKMATQARAQATKHLMKYSMNDIISWTVVSVPTPSWAKKVFEGLDEDQAVNRLWDDIFSFVRVGEEDPIKAWDDHISAMEKRATILNEKNLDRLIYKSEEGTDLVVGLPEGHIWIAASSVNANGVKFIPNMPTEEIYTAPDRNRVDGRLLSTRPLSYNGVLIDGMDLKFQDGKRVDYSAQAGEETLDMLVNMDEGASFLGEIALVPHDSPISNAKTTYYNTLFDENASCHFAFGKAYPTSVENGQNMSEEELQALGINDSIVHEDFMVGSKTLSIVGIEEDGTEFPIFEDGNFVF